MAKGTTSKDLIKSMTTYVSLIKSRVEEMERLVGRKPAALNQHYVTSSECELKRAKDQHGRMLDAFNKQAHHVADDKVDLHQQLWEEAKKAYIKATEAAVDILYGRTPPAGGPAQHQPQPQGPDVPRIIEDLKPKDALASSANIE